MHCTMIKLVLILFCSAFTLTTSQPSATKTSHCVASPENIPRTPSASGGSDPKRGEYESPTENPNSAPPFSSPLLQEQEYVCTTDAWSVIHPHTKTKTSHDGEEDDFDDLMVTLRRHVDVGVRQRIDGSDAEKEAVRDVLKKMEAYFRLEVMARPAYENVRGQCKNNNELCSFWTSVGECESNRGFMLTNCAASCRLCLLLHTNFG